MKLFTSIKSLKLSMNFKHNEKLNQTNESWYYLIISSLDFAENARYQNMSQLSIKLIMLKICYFLNPKKTSTRCTRKMKNVFIVEDLQPSKCLFIFSTSMIFHFLYMITHFGNEGEDR